MSDSLLLAMALERLSAKFGGRVYPHPIEPVLCWELPYDYPLQREDLDAADALSRAHDAPWYYGHNPGARRAVLMFRSVRPGLAACGVPNARPWA
jgi:hypothetical protein